MGAPGGEDEVRAAYDRAHQALGTPEADAARGDYLNTLVRVHRAGEGAGFEGIQPAGSGVTPQVAAADKALEVGNIEPLRGLIEAERWTELESRFQKALSLKDFDPNDLGAARTYMDAYVSFFKYAEGHDHDHHHGHEHHAHAGH